MTANESRVDPETEASINRALDEAQLRAGDATTASTVHPEPNSPAVEDGGAGDGE